MTPLRTESVVLAALTRSNALACTLCRQIFTLAGRTFGAAASETVPSFSCRKRTSTFVPDAPLPALRTVGLRRVSCHHSAGERVDM